MFNLDHLEMSVSLPTVIRCQVSLAAELLLPVIDNGNELFLSFFRHSCPEFPLTLNRNVPVCHK